MEEVKTEKKADNSKKLLVAACVLLGIVLVILLVLLLRPRTDMAGLTRETSALAGQLEGKTHEQIVEELNRVVQEGMFNISINASPVFADGKSEGPLKIENVPGNKYLMQVEISLDDTDEVIYKTGIIEPNHHIQDAKLDVELEAGTYRATAVFNAYAPDTEEYVGSAGAKMTITILN